MKLLRRRPRLDQRIKGSCYKYLLENKPRTKQAASSKAFQTMLEKTFGMDEVVTLNEQVTNFIKEAQKEKIKSKKKCKDIAAIFNEEARPKSPPRLIKTTDLFREIDLDNPAIRAEYEEFQFQHRLKLDSIATICRTVEKKKKFQALLPWRKKIPKICLKKVYESPLVRGPEKGNGLQGASSAYIRKSPLDDLGNKEDLNKELHKDRAREQLAELQDNRRFITDFKGSLLKSKVRVNWIYTRSHLNNCISELRQTKLIKY